LARRDGQERLARGEVGKRGLTGLGWRGDEMGRDLLRELEEF
jgi:hypothetical protein